MQIDIHYCAPWNYKLQGASLADEIYDAFGIEVTLVRGSDGIFTVEVDGKCLFSRSESGRFPEPGEITEMIKSSGTWLEWR